MSRRQDLIAGYARDLREHCGIEPDMDLLTKVAIGCGPAIYKTDAALVASSQREELDLVRRNFLVKKLGLKDGPELSEAIDAMIETYGGSNRRKQRAVLYYLLTRHFRKEAVYG